MKHRLVTILCTCCCIIASVLFTSMAQSASSAYQTPAWSHTGGPLGGLGYDIRYNFATPDTWYATDAWAGLHMSTDNGVTWFPSNAGIEIQWGPTGDTITIFSATVDPINPATVWIGTQYTGQIFRSTDGGLTWEEKVNGIDQGLRPLSFRGFTVDPRSSDIVYAMAEIGSPGWTPNGETRTGVAQDLTQGIVYRTTDGGENWSQIWRGDNLARYCWIDPRDPDVLYVSTGIFDREAANTDAEAGFPEGVGGVGIIKSTDGGANWNIIDQDNGLLDLFVGSLYLHPDDPNVLLAAASNGTWWDLGSRNTAGVYLSENGGETWQRVLDGEIYTSVEFCTGDSQVAYAGSSEAIYRSMDRGRNWQRFGRPDNTWGSPGVIAGWPIDMQCDPRNAMRIFVNNYLGGNFLSIDGGENWVSVSKGYTGEETHAVSVVPGSPRTVVTGGRVGIFRSDNGGHDWDGLAYPPEGSQMRLNEVATVAVDPGNADHLLAAPLDVFALVESFDGGRSWDVAPLPGSAYSPVDLDYALSDPKTVYAAVAQFNCKFSMVIPPEQCDVPGTGVYLSRDSGSTWQATPGISSTSILAVAVDPGNSDIAYAGTSKQGVLKTTDGGVTWAPHSNGLPDMPILDLAVNPVKPALIFAGTAGASIYRSTNGASTWTASGIGLPPEASVRSIVIDATNPQIIYAGDHFSGVYVSLNEGMSWEAINTGLDHRAVTALDLSDDGSVLYAGILGAGVYRLGGQDIIWDLLPCGHPNAFNCKRRSGAVPLAIFGDQGFDAASIDTSSLRLVLASQADVPAIHPWSTYIADVASPADLDQPACSPDDGYPDLNVTFDAAAVSELIGCPIGKQQESPPLVLQGAMLDGTPLIPVNVQVLTDVSK